MPHGANFNVTWDAEAVKWSGTLTIPAPGFGIFRDSVVSADDGAVFALLQRLERKFHGLKEVALLQTSMGNFGATVAPTRGRGNYFLST